MTRLRTRTALAVGALALFLAACGGVASSGEITVTNARVPVLAGANGAAYMTLTNSGDGADRLIGASTTVAEAAELHQSSMENGSMAMQQVDGVEIPGGGEAILEPGGYHVMLIGVTNDLAEGDTVDLTLTFDNAVEQTVTAQVVPVGDVDKGSEPMEMDSQG